MKLSFWMVAKAVVETLFGIGYVLMPVPVVSMFGGTLNHGAATFVQLCGAVFLASAIILWRSRNELPSSPFVRSIVIATVVSNAIGLYATLSAVLSGAWNASGLDGCVLQPGFCIGFRLFPLHEAGQAPAACSRAPVFPTWSLFHLKARGGLDRRPARTRRYRRKR